MNTRFPFLGAAPRLAVVLLALVLDACGGGGGGSSQPVGCCATQPGTLSFDSSGTVVSQSAGTVTLNVDRNGGASGQVTVAYATSNASASAGTDYTTTSGVLTWADGDGSAQTITVPVSNATPFFGTRTFAVTLSAPTGGATLASPVATTVSINGSALPSAANQVGVTLGPGPSNDSLNIVYTTVTLCAASGSPCQTIDNVQVDTGSVGFRVLASVLGNGLATSQLTPVVINNEALVECTQFADGYSWGPIALATVTVGGETAQNVPVQVIGDPAFEGTNVIPSACSAPIPTEEDTVATFGANAILGIGNFLQDCGLGCAENVPTGDAYNLCTLNTSPTACTPYAATLAQQVSNPVSAFPVDNNGILLQLPAVATAGAASPTGTLTFGVATESNNTPGAGVVAYPLVPDGEANAGTFSSTFNGQTLDASFVDSGSNAYFFNDSSIPDCASPATYFFCPTTTLSLSATIDAPPTPSITVGFTVQNVDGISNSATAAPGIAGSAGSTETEAFDWGAPFFFGRNVYIGIENSMILGTAGPLVAF
jgi:hypothetical protein